MHSTHEPSPAGSLTLLGRAIGLPKAFEWWCERHGVDDLPSFLDVNIPADETGPAQVWAQLQASVRLAQQHAAKGDTDGARQALEDLFARPEFRKSRGDADTREEAERLVGCVLCSKRKPGTNARIELARAGGIASARFLADRLTEATGKRVTVRTVRDRLRHTRGSVRKLGAGYYALEGVEAVPVLDWVYVRLSASGPEDVRSLAAAILGAYPNGHRTSVLAWLHQEPGGIRIRGAEASLALPRGVG